MSADPIGVVCGLKSEAALLTSLRETGRLQVFLSGADSSRARSAAERLVTDGVSALVSFGLCGALHPDLAAGDLVLADAVVSERPDVNPWHCDAAWLTDLRPTLSESLRKRCHVGCVLGAERVIAIANEKVKLGQAYGALAVDMESHAVAEAAVRHGLPFLVLRACSDDATQDLPEAALRATQADGSVKIAPVLAALSRQPGQLAGLMALAKGSKRAHAALARALESGALLPR